MKTTGFDLHGRLKLAVSSDRASAHRFFAEELAVFAADVKDADVRVVVGPVPGQPPDWWVDNGKYAIADDSISFIEWYKILRLRLRLTGLRGPVTTLHLDGHALTYRLLLLKFLIPALRLRLLPHGLTLVKASAIATDEGVWLIPAWSGGGKTSLVLYALERGYGFWSDTFSLVGQDGQVYPLPRPLHLFWRNVAACPALWAGLGRRDRLAFQWKHLLHRLSGRTLNLSHRLTLGADVIGHEPRPLRGVLFVTTGRVPAWQRGPDQSPDRMIARMLANDQHETRIFDAAYWAYDQGPPASWPYWSDHVGVLARALAGVPCRQAQVPARSRPQDFDEMLDWLAT
ncbi:MAG: hypothetical protein KKA73_14445 [Chloroflexi bacterium]|nr:hypothetical protein [Chloroflexota bacterium]